MTTTRAEQTAAARNHADAQEWLAMCNTEHATNPSPDSKRLVLAALDAARTAGNRLRLANERAFTTLTADRT